MKGIIQNIATVILLLIAVQPVAHAQQIDSKWAVRSSLAELELNQNQEKVKLKTELERLEDAFDINFMFRTELLEGKYVQSKKELSDNLVEELRRLLWPHNLTYQRINNRSFALSKVEESLQLVSEQENVATVSGRVTDAESGETLPAVNVSVKGTTVGTSTDEEGRYELTNVPSLQDTLVFSFVGYQTQEVPIDGRTEIHIALNPQAIAGEEVVVVGYGTQTRENLTGSVSSVSGENMEKVPTTNLSNSLSGRLPGIVTVNSSGEPGYDGASINIRGVHTLNNNNPLIVIDGVPNRGGGLERLNPKDIQDITVLKDASAAIYGAQAANGVILVTTKRGQEGAPEFTLTINQGFSQPTRIPEMANAATYLTMLNEVDIYNNREPSIPQETIENHRNQTDPWLYPNTDYFAEVIKPMSFQTKGDMSISGGNESIRYFLSFGGLTEDGIYRNSQTRYNQYNFRSNIDGQVADNITLSFDVSGRLEDRNFPTIGASLLFGELQRGKPNQHLFWPNGRPAPNFEGGRNPAILATDATGYLNDERYYLQSNLKLEVNIPAIDGLSFTANAVYDKDFRERKEWQTPWTLYSWDFETYDSDGSPVLEPQRTRGYSEPRLSQRSEDGYNTLLNLVVNYAQDLENHSFEIMAGTEQQRFGDSYIDGFKRFFVSDQIDQMFAGGEDQREIDGNASKGARLNYFSRLNYSYKSKYLLEYIARYDGSYIFPEEGRYGFFPSVSVGWRLTQEDWFTDITDFFNELKVRASWGQTGNDRIDEWQYLTSFGFSGGYLYGSDVEVPSITPERTPNPEVTWEVANQLDVGIEGSIFNSRLSFEADYFNYLREDILTFRNASIPQTTGLELPRENIGEVKSWGYDGSISWRDQINNNFRYNITLNGGYANNEILYWDEPPGAPEWQRSTGAPMNTELYFKAIGVFETQEDIDNYPHWPGARPGDIRFEDINDDGVIDADDRIRVERTGLPKWNGGITFNGAYKSFDFNIFFQGAAGASQYVFSRSGELGNYFKDFAEKRWTPDNPNPNHPRTYNRQENYWADNQNTYFLRDADYIRLKSLEVGYNLPPSIITRFGLQNFRIYANGYNLLTWDTLNTFDPEGRSATAQFYPPERVVNLGLSLTF